MANVQLFYRLPLFFWVVAGQHEPENQNGHANHLCLSVNPVQPLRIHFHNSKQPAYIKQFYS